MPRRMRSGIANMAPPIANVALPGPVSIALSWLRKGSSLIRYVHVDDGPFTSTPRRRSDAWRPGERAGGGRAGPDARPRGAPCLSLCAPPGREGPGGRVVDPRERTGSAEREGVDPLPHPRHEREIFAPGAVDLGQRHRRLRAA